MLIRNEYNQYDCVYYANSKVVVHLPDYILNWIFSVNPNCGTHEATHREGYRIVFNGKGYQGQWGASLYTPDNRIYEFTAEDWFKRDRYAHLHTILNEDGSQTTYQTYRYCFNMIEESYGYYVEAYKTRGNNGELLLSSSDFSTSSEAIHYAEKLYLQVA